MKLENHGMRENILHIQELKCHVISTEENRVSRHNGIFRHTCMYKQPIWTKQPNYNDFVQILYSYLRFTDKFVDVLILLLTVILLELHENQRKNIQLQKMVHRKTCVRDITFLAKLPASYVIFCSFFLSTSSFSSAVILQRRKKFALENGGRGGCCTPCPPVFMEQRNQRKAQINLSSICF